MLKRNDFAEKRQFGRRATNSQAWIKIAGRPTIPCTVRDVSDGGAMIETEPDVWLPFSFRLITADGQVDRICEIRHQRGIRYGVEFVTAAQASTAIAQTVIEANTWMGSQALRR